jgi:PAS domain S-box-containing protein
MVAAIEDVTVRKQAEETFDAIPDLIFVTDVQQRIVRANLATAERLGVTRDEVLGRPCREVIRGGAKLQVSNSHRKQAIDGREHQFETHEPHLGGDFLVSCTPLYDARGELTGTVHVARDVTELRRSERLTDRLRAENMYLQEEITSSLGFDEIVGDSELLRSTLAKVEHVAPTDASVLLQGETGTGKELVARAIHDHSPRKQRPLVKVNLAALPSSLIESELFGHVKGAFTGAVADKIGRFQLADRGTLFLDEIGELDLELQTKLLRVLQEGEFEQIGSAKTIRVDVRLVTATNRDLRRAMELGKFRPDLYYRLAVFPIEVPPLRLRRDDIPLLAWHFIAKKQNRLGRKIKQVSAETMRALLDYDWPGNIRELENVIERAMILAVGPTLTLPDPLRPSPRLTTNILPGARADLDRDHILAVLDACRWKIKGVGNAAEQLGLKPSTLRYRMKTLGIERPGPQKALIGTK